MACGPNSITFNIMDWDGNDQVGVDIFKTASGDETYLDADFNLSATTCTVVDTTNFAATGTFHIGCERVTYGGKSATTFTDCVRGTLHPFSKDGGTAHIFARDHQLPSTEVIGVDHKPKVTEDRRVWVGRWVSLHMHRIVGGTIDTRANAQLVFAGKISGVADSPAGTTLITCEDVKSVIRDTTIFHDQYRAKIGIGLYLKAGDEIVIRETGVDSAAANFDNSVTLTATVGASGVTQIEAALTYTPSQILSALADLVASVVWKGEPLLAFYADTRFLVRFNYAAANDSLTISIKASGDILPFLGFTESQLLETWDSTSDSVARLAFYSDPGSGYKSIMAMGEPAESWATTDGAAITAHQASGVWFNNTAWLPQPWKSLYTDAGENWGLLKVGEKNIILAKYASATSFTEVYSDIELVRLFGDDVITADQFHLMRRAAGNELEIRQILVLNGPVRDIIASLFISTGTSTYNHASWDQYPNHMGAAIPTELINTDFQNSLKQLASSTIQDTMTMFVEKPTALQDLLEPDLIIRAATIQWKNEELIFVRPHRAAPTGLAQHTLTENNKASESPGDDQRPTAEITKQWMRNVFTIKYNRAFSDTSEKYNSVENFKYQSSINDHGERPLTIKARNTFGTSAGTVETLESHMVDFLAGPGIVYGRPLLRMTRTVEFSLFENVCPGDLVSVTDNHTRDPATGLRGLTTKGGIIIGHRFSWGSAGGGMFGEVDILFTELDNVTIYSPTAQLDDGATNSGYVIATKVATCYANKHSESGETADAANFVVGDKIRVIEIDPSDPAAPSTAVDTVAAQSGNTITLTTGFAAFDNTLKYRIISDDYATAVATQKTDAYLADDADTRIVNSRDAYEYGSNNLSFDYTVAAATELPERHTNTMLTEGEPLSTGHHQSVAKMVNNLVNYKTAPGYCPMWAPGHSQIQSSGSATYVVRWIMPYYAGPGSLPGSLRRMITIAPLMSSTVDTDTVSCRVTISKRPPTGSAETGVNFSNPYRQQTFTTSSSDKAIVTNKQVEAIYDVQTGVGFVTVELAGNASGAACNFDGLAEFRLDPLA
jgi:hypothetical protein